MSDFPLFLQMTPGESSDQSQPPPVERLDLLRTIFDEPGMFTPAKDGEHDVVMVKQENIVTIPFEDRLEIKKRKKRYTGLEIQPIKFKRDKGSTEAHSPNLSLLPSTRFSSPEDSDLSDNSSSTISFHEKKASVETIDLTLDTDVETSEMVDNGGPDDRDITDATEETALFQSSLCFGIQETIEVELSIQSLSEEDSPPNEELASINRESTAENPAPETNPEQNIAERSLKSISNSESVNSETVSYDCPSSSSPQEVIGETTSRTTEVNNNIPESANVQQRKKEHATVPEKSLFETNSDFLEDTSKKIFANGYIPLTVSYYHLDKEERDLREAADRNKADGFPIQRKRNIILKEREHLKDILAARKLDLEAKEQALNSAIDLLASNSGEIFKINEEYGNLTSSVRAKNVKILNAKVELFELQAEIHRNQIKIQTNLCTEDSLAIQMADMNEQIKKLTEEIAQNEQLLQKETHASRDASEKLKRRSHEDTVLRRKIEELEVQHQASLKLVEESQLKFAEIMKRLRETDKQFKTRILNFLLLESKMVAVQTCRKQKRLQERVLNVINDLRETEASERPQPSAILPTREE